MARTTTTSYNYKSASNDNSLAAQIARDKAAISSKTSGTTKSSTTASSSSNSNDAAEAAAAAAALAAKKQAYEDLKKGIKASGADLGNASADLLNVAELLSDAFTGKASNAIKNTINAVQETFNEITNKLDDIYKRANQIEAQLGGTSGTTNSGLSSSVLPFQGGTAAGIYNCDTEILRNTVIPLLKNADKSLEKASTTASGLKKEEGCEDIGNISPQINDAKKNVKGLYEQVEAAIEAAENAESVNMGIVNAFGSSVAKFTTRTTTAGNTIIKATTTPTRTATTPTRSTTTPTRTATTPTRSTTTPTRTTYFDPNTTYDTEYYKIDGDNLRGYLFSIPSSANNYEELPLIVYLHGLSHAKWGEERFENSGIIGAINESDLENPNAYILMPQLKEWQGSPWCNDQSVDEVQKLIDEIVAEYNIDKDKIIIMRP